MQPIISLIVCLTAFILFGPPSHAASLRVAPVILDMKVPQAASTIRVWNDAPRAIHVQVRVFRWDQKNGEDVYTPTNDVAASPPIIALNPGGENLIRVVRTSKRAIGKEESYRLIVDELPEPSRRQAGVVNLVVRHSIPVFFTPPDSSPATSWTIERARGGYVVTVRNDGTQRLRVSNLVLSSKGRTLARRGGLVGYVLGKSSVAWFVPAKSGPSGGTVTISADSEGGRLNAQARMRGG